MTDVLKPDGTPYTDPESSAARIEAFIQQHSPGTCKWLSRGPEGCACPRCDLDRVIAARVAARLRERLDGDEVLREAISTSDRSWRGLKPLTDVPNPPVDLRPYLDTATWPHLQELLGQACRAWLAGNTDSRVRALGEGAGVLGLDRPWPYTDPFHPTAVGTAYLLVRAAWAQKTGRPAEMADALHAACHALSLIERDTCPHAHCVLRP